MASLTALVAILLTSSAVGAGLWAMGADSSAKRERAAAQRERDTAKQSDLTAEFAKQEADRATREAEQSRRLLYASDMSLAQQAWDAGLTGRDVLVRHWPQAGQKDLRGFDGAASGGSAATAAGRRCAATREGSPRSPSRRTARHSLQAAIPTTESASGT